MRGVEFSGPGPVPMASKRGYASGAGAFQHGFAVVRELREIDVRVGVDEFHGRCARRQIVGCVTDFTSATVSRRREPYERAPTSTSSRKPARTGRPSGPAEAATIMPLDSTPRSLRGARLMTTATLRPINFSGS